MVIAYLLTCSKYTATARPLIMVVIVIESVFLERCIVNWFLSGEIYYRRYGELLYACVRMTLQI